MRLSPGFIVIVLLLQLTSCGSEETPEKFTVYQDADDDGYGNADVFKEVTREEDGYVTDDTDCDDTDEDVHPGAEEIPDNLVDENCDNILTTTYYQDFDTDGYGNPSVSQVAVTMPSGYVANNTDCNDNDINIHPGTTDIKGNVVDEDCDGSSAPVIIGDGVIDLGEECDDNNSVSGDGCSSAGRVESGYQCVGVPSVCTVILICGNGVVESGQQCDDGNTISGDGCSSSCTVEPGYTCVGSPSVCTLH